MQTPQSEPTEESTQEFENIPEWRRQFRQLIQEATCQEKTREGDQHKREPSKSKPVSP